MRSHVSRQASLSTLVLGAFLPKKRARSEAPTFFLQGLRLSLLGQRYTGHAAASLGGQTSCGGSGLVVVLGVATLRGHNVLLVVWPVAQGVVLGTRYKMVGD